MSGEAHLHQKVVVSLSVGCLSTYLLQVFFWGGVQLIVNRGSMPEATGQEASSESEHESLDE